MVMIRRNFHLTQEQNDFLESFNDLSASEHIRRAIDEYIEKRRTTAVASPSKIKIRINGKEVEDGDLSVFPSPTDND